MSLSEQASGWEKVRDLIALETARLEEKYRSNIEYQQGDTTYSIGFDSDDVAGRLGRSVLGILVSSEGKNIDIASFAPRGTTFKTRGIIQREISGYYSKYSDASMDIPLAETVRGRGGESEVLFNPDIFELRGGALFLLHEIGHCWQDVREEFSGTSYSRAYVEQSKRENLNDLDLAQLIDCFGEWEAGENDAWNYALDVYKKLKAQGINICPQFKEGEEDFYPQALYDELHNKRSQLPLELVGRRFTWRRVEK